MSSVFEPSRETAALLRRLGIERKPDVEGLQLVRQARELAERVRALARSDRVPPGSARTLARDSAERFIAALQLLERELGGP